MMNEIKITLDDRLVAAGLARAPEVIEKNVDEALATGAKDAVEAMQAILVKNRSVARNALYWSVHVEKIAAMRYFVGTGVKHARMVEEGTGPAAGRRSYMPDSRDLEDYVKQRAGITLKGRKGSVTRRRQLAEIHDRAYALALHIKQHGTKAHPFVAPTRDLMEPKIRVLAAEAVNKSLREIFA